MWVMFEQFTAEIQLHISLIVLPVDEQNKQIHLCSQIFAGARASFVRISTPV